MARAVTALPRASTAVLEQPAAFNFLVRWRPALWVAFLGLTATILAYPVNLRLEPFTVWSPDIFPRLPVFGVFFYLWAASLALLLFTSPDETVARWERLFLIAAVTLVFRGFWNLIAPIQGQALGHVTTTLLWQQDGHVGPGPAVAYLAWPGVSLSHSLLSQISGLELFPATAMLNLAVALVIATSTYIFLLTILKKSLPAALSCLLIIEGSVALIILLSGGPLALAFLLSFLAVLFSKGDLASAPRLLVALLLLMAASITHLHTAVHFPFILLGLWGAGVLAKRQLVPLVSVHTVMLFFLIPAAWALYWNVNPFTWIVTGAWTSLSELEDMYQRLLALFTIGQANVGPSVPLWYSGVRLFWFALLYVAGGLVWLWSLGMLHRLDSRAKGACAAFAGVLLLALVSVVMSTAGFSQLLRLLQTGVFFTSLFLLLFLHRLKELARRAALLGLACLVFGLSLPTFLATNPWVNTLYAHPPELTAGQTLQSLYGVGQGLTVFGTSGATRFIQHYLYEADISIESQKVSQGGNWSEEALWEDMDALLAEADNSRQRGNPVLFIHSYKFALEMNARMGIPPDHPRWSAFASRLARSYGRSYDNGPFQVYQGG